MKLEPYPSIYPSVWLRKGLNLLPGFEDLMGGGELPLLPLPFFWSQLDLLFLVFFQVLANQEPCTPVSIFILHK